ncbi:hypothetical protein JCM10449v2_004982 [Rhodotorula kratochvilovae]
MGNKSVLLLNNCVRPPLCWPRRHPQALALDHIPRYWRGKTCTVLHCVAFEPTKTDAVLSLPPTRRHPANPPRVVLRGVPVAYAPSLTMLGTEIDEKLTFGPHIARTAERAAVTLRGVGLLTCRRADLAPRWARQLVVACVLPRLVWASAA